MTLLSHPAPHRAAAELDRPGSLGLQDDADGWLELPRPRRLRQRTLVMLRWLAVTGQTAAVLVVHFGLGFDTPLAWCLGVIAASAWLNVALSLTRPMQEILSDGEAALQIAYDVAQLTTLLAFTGGLSNPFSLLLIAPAAVGAAALPLRHVTALGALTLACTLVLAKFHLALPWDPAEPLILPPIYELALWAAIVIGVIFTAGYAWSASQEAARMELALATTQAVLAREQRLSSLGALAAAAAHELGTPLATIQVVAKEMTRSTTPDDPMGEDARLLLSQAERCREILKRLSRDPDSGDAMVATTPLGRLLDEIAEPYRNFGPEVVTGAKAKDDSPEPITERSPEIIHALSALVENAVDFAADCVVLLGHYDAESVIVEVADDGPGFSPNVLAKLGEPYVTSRPNAEGSRTGHHGMGLGFFIAKTLLERTGADVSFRNGKRGGAVVCVCWSRERIEAPPEALQETAQS